ncbi:hypothetical protein LU631_22325 [Erwinia tracheiphila]|uniref:Uncharacterized protein n=1 Tax=Erwinia tracheiphila TaxID=65700 RepID=A0A0M2KFI1_9GAMM|nr:hypothetical protein [Erwinia tracheiphila]EOS94884.1 hypothetical protein ETR_11102 [Erwinia tracheiphila PSU-1]KKF36092.1 hypothetical protein SY86_12715 [Erwinia tracheiphila]UIA87412.1 hypothetical protein LU631_22325 [Erwinia tracheiphila]UIA95777.1 hypothetical protein LU633_20770 [Erwinia tracheiphila]
MKIITFARAFLFHSTAAAAKRASSDKKYAPFAEKIISAKKNLTNTRIKKYDSLLETVKKIKLADYNGTGDTVTHVASKNCHAAVLEEIKVQLAGQPAKINNAQSTHRLI